MIWIGLIYYAMDGAVRLVGDEGEFFAGADRAERKDRFGGFDELVDLEILNSFFGKDLAEHVIRLNQQFLKTENAQIPVQVLLTFFCGAICWGLLAKGSIDGFRYIESQGCAQN